MRSEFSHRSLHGAKADRRRLLAATALVVVLVGIDFASHGSVRALARIVAASAWSATHGVSDAIFSAGYFVSHRSLAQENAALRAQLAQYQEKAAAYDALASDNAQLRTLLQISESHSGITAPIVSSFRSSPYGTFLIGAGSGDPIAVGDAVLTSGGFLVGTVHEVLMRTSGVKALFAAGNRTDALIGKTAVVLTGDGGGSAHTSVPRGIELREGEPVIAPVYGKPIGIVGHVESSPTSADQTVYIRLPVNLTELRYVFVAHE